MWADLRRFLRTYVRRRKWTFGTVQLMHVVAVLLLLSPPILIRHVIDKVIPARDLGLLGLCAGGIVAIYGLWALLHGLKEYWGHEVAQSITSRQRNDLYSHLQKLSMSFHDDKKTGELLSRLVDDINVIQEIVHHGPETILIGIVTLLGAGGIMLYLDWRLAVVAMVVAPLLVVCARRPMSRMLQQFRTVRKDKASLSEVLEENLAGMRVIKAFVSEDRETGAVSQANEDHYRSRMGAIRYIATLFPVTLFLNNVGLAVVLLYGGLRAFEGALTIGTLTAFLFYLGRFHQPILRMMMMSERGGEFFTPPHIVDAHALPVVAAKRGPEGRMRVRAVDLMNHRAKGLHQRIAHQFVQHGDSNGGGTTDARAARYQYLAALPAFPPHEAAGLVEHLLWNGLAVVEGHVADQNVGVFHRIGQGQQASMPASLSRSSFSASSSEPT